MNSLDKVSKKQLSTAPKTENGHHLPATHTHTQTFIQEYKGPIPPPEYLVYYETLSPGISKRYIDEPLKESEERRRLQRDKFEKQHALESRGQLLAAFFMFTWTVGSLGAIYLGHDLGGIAALIGAVTMLITSFLRTKRKESLETKKSE